MAEHAVPDAAIDFWLDKVLPVLAFASASLVADSCSAMRCVMLVSRAEPVHCLVTADGPL